LSTEPAAGLQAAPRVELLGHRGARGLFPENTIEGFRAAMALGVRAFELDVGLTRDGVVVVHHDPALSPDIARAPHGGWLAPPGPLLQDLSFAELQRFDVGRIRPGSGYAARYPAQAPIDGARIPRLAEVLALDAGARITIEMKTRPDRPDWTAPPERMAEAVAAVVDAAGAAARVAVSSFDWRGVRHMRRIRPGIARAWLTEPRTVRDAPTWWDRAPPTADAVPDAVAAEGGGTWSPEHTGLMQAELDCAHALGLRVVPWTVNEPAAIARLLRWGVDGLITDRPDLAREAV